MLQIPSNSFTICYSIEFRLIRRRFNSSKSQHQQNFQSKQIQERTPSVNTPQIPKRRPCLRPRHRRIDRSQTLRRRLSPAQAHRRTRTPLYRAGHHPLPSSNCRDRRRKSGRSGGPLPSAQNDQRHQGRLLGHPGCFGNRWQASERLCPGQRRPHPVLGPRWPPVRRYPPGLPGQTDLVRVPGWRTNAPTWTGENFPPRIRTRSIFITTTAWTSEDMKQPFLSWRHGGEGSSAGERIRSQTTMKTPQASAATTAWPSRTKPAGTTGIPTSR